MNAAELAESLEGRREGSNYRCRCPVHGGRSLMVRDADRDNPLVFCHAGCEFRDIVAALRDRGLWTDSEPRKTPSQRKETKRKREIAKARRALDEFEKVYANDSTPLLDSDWRKRDWAMATLRRYGEC